MRFIFAAVAAALIATPAFADTMAHCSAAWKAKAPPAVATGSYKAWSTTCLAKGYTFTNNPNGDVSTPIAHDPAPPGATAMCRDGTYTKTVNQTGACSAHRGVAKWL